MIMMKWWYRFAAEDKDGDDAYNDIDDDHDIYGDNAGCNDHEHDSEDDPGDDYDDALDNDDTNNADGVYDECDYDDNVIW